MDSLNEMGGAEKPALISQAIDLMWKKFLPEIRRRARVLEDAGRAAATRTLSEAEREEAQSAAHKLAGTLGTFGLGRGTKLARELEQMYAAHAGPAARLSAMAAEICAIIESRK